jgi:glycosyltransferase involved in cell wall biosynthesis
MVAARGDKYVLTKTDSPYTFEGVHAVNIDTPNVLDIKADPRPIAKQLEELNAKVVIGQNELSLPAVKAASMVGAVSVVNVHTPPKYGRGIQQAVIDADYAIYNTQTSATQWGEPNALVVHPPISPLPKDTLSGGDAYTLLSSLANKGVQVVLDLAKQYPNQRFIIVRSPAEPTHGIEDLMEQAARLPNVELHPRVSPEEVVKYFKQTRILLVPSRYETYGMSTIEAAGYGIPTVHVDTPHVREGIGEAAILVPPLSLMATAEGIETIEENYQEYADKARARAEWLDARQKIELEQFADFIDTATIPKNKSDRARKVLKASRRRYS